MLLTQLTLGNTLAHKDVSTPEFGEGAEVRVSQLSVKGYTARMRMHRVVRERGLSDEDTLDLILAANIMSCLVNPESNDLLLKEDQLDDFANALTADTFQNLLLAVGELNPVKADQSLSSKKKKS